MVQIFELPDTVGNPFMHAVHGTRGEIQQHCRAIGVMPVSIEPINPSQDLCIVTFAYNNKGHSMAAHFKKFTDPY